MCSVLAGAVFARVLRPLPSLRHYLQVYYTNTHARSLATRNTHVSSIVNIPVIIRCTHTPTPASRISRVFSIFASANITILRECVSVCVFVCVQLRNKLCAIAIATHTHTHNLQAGLRSVAGSAKRCVACVRRLYALKFVRAHSVNVLGAERSTDEQKR